MPKKERSRGVYGNAMVRLRTEVGTVLDRDSGWQSFFYGPLLLTMWYDYGLGWINAWRTRLVCGLVVFACPDGGELFGRQIMTSDWQRRFMCQILHQNLPRELCRESSPVPNTDTLVRLCWDAYHR